MKKKLKVLIAFSVLMICMSSCVYSLFPIYTKDSIVFIPELVGRWQSGSDPDQYIEFTRNPSLETTITFSDTKETTNTNTKVTSEWNVEPGDNDFLVIEGDTIRDKEVIKAYWEESMDSLSEEFENGLVEMADELGEAMNKLGKALNNLGKPNPMKYSKSEKSYIMKIVGSDREVQYEATVTEIGGDYFLDLYASEGDLVDRNMESRVWFPVHTFMKIQIEGDELHLIEFDMEKMNKLFDSNLVRIRHENVDGTVLITAGTRELRKFLDRYSDDESVFEGAEVYSRIPE